MPAVEEIVETELERVERWRAEELMRAGYDPAGAAELAARLDIDLHPRPRSSSAAARPTSRSRFSSRR